MCHPTIREIKRIIENHIKPIAPVNHGAPLADKDIPGLKVVARSTIELAGLADLSRIGLETRDEAEAHAHQLRTAALAIFTGIRAYERAKICGDAIKMEWLLSNLSLQYSNLTESGKDFCYDIGGPQIANMFDNAIHER